MQVSLCLLRKLRMAAYHEIRNASRLLLERDQSCELHSEWRLDASQWHGWTKLFATNLRPQEAGFEVPFCSTVSVSRA